MRFQRCTLMTLTLLAMVLVAHLVAAETRRGRLRKGRSPPVALFSKFQYLQEKCPTYKSNEYFPVKSNITALESELRGDIRTRSLCPWTYRLDENNERYPRQISEAVCAKSCIGFELNRDGSSGFDLNPVEIKQQILVLKKEKNGCTFSLETKTIVVGCTCVTSDS